MLLAYPFRVLVPRRTPETATSTAVALLLFAGALDLVPTPVVIALSAGAGATLAGVRLSRLAVSRRVDPAPRTAGVLLDAAVVTAGLTAVALPLGGGWRTVAALVGALLVAALAGAGLCRLPGRTRPTVGVRLRGLVESTGPAVGLALAGWLLLPPVGPPVPVRLVAALALGGLGMAALTAFAGPRRRSPTAVCRGGVLLTVGGLVLLAALPSAPTGRVTLLVVPPLVLGLLLVAVGAVDAADAGDTAPAEPVASAWPRSVLPAAVLLLAAAPHLGSGHAPDRTSVVLALAAVPPLVLRELLRGRDAPGSARPAAHRRPAAGPVRHRHAVQPRWLGDLPSTAPVHDPHDQRDSAGPLTAYGAGSTWPAEDDAGWSALSRRPVPAGNGPPGDRAALLDALAAIGDVPAPSGALLLVDLHVTDGIGPTAREDVLAEAVHRVRAVIASDDVVTGCTGAGFAVVTAAGPVLAYALGTRLLAALAPPYQVAGAVVRAQTSIGLAEVSGDRPADVLRQAELARRRAVQLGRDRVEWYDAFLEEQLVRRLDLERELPGAVARGELDLVYQPVVDLADGQPVGAEALLRWRSPVLGTVLPAELLPVAEDLDLVGELEWWVLDRACRQLSDWSVGVRELWMAVNVTTRELTTPDFVQRAAAVLAAYGVPPERLVVEVSEPKVAGDLSTVVARLAGLRSLGVRTALDDFRAEHASLAQLRRLPIDLLKVGPELVGARPDGQPPLIDVVVNVGERLGVEIVAEELESSTQVEVARRGGCRYGQGFALARPATAERVEAYFEEFPSASR
ncbi:putative bifunctional diguanylate cyclase/phosphodiesterase [Micromonospora sp. DT231]|uniref:putative bifunctional diguanylate cyclase/phosphodiesterase n=1 Tax=Micromonospora sp. DT231 TaxID=3416526 RepID=UPI003CE84AEC